MFELSIETAIEPIGSTDISNIIQHCVTTFHGHGLTDYDIAIFAEQATDWNISKKIVTDRLVGFYLLQEASVADWATNRLDWARECNLLDVYGHCEIREDLRPYHGRHGVEGVALVVLPEYQGLGYGSILKKLPKSMGYDHVFGEHFKSSNNLHHWLKCRRLIAECDGIWVTLQDL